MENTVYCKLTDTDMERDEAVDIALLAFYHQFNPNVEQYLDLMFTREGYAHFFRQFAKHTGLCSDHETDMFDMFYDGSIDSLLWIPIWMLDRISEVEVYKFGEAFLENALWGTRN